MSHKGDASGGKKGRNALGDPGEGGRFIQGCPRSASGAFWAATGCIIGVCGLQALDGDRRGLFVCLFVLFMVTKSTVDDVLFGSVPQSPLRILLTW